MKLGISTFPDTNRLRNWRRESSFTRTMFLHTICGCNGCVRDCGFELADHPPYSPDLAPSEYLLYRNMKTKTLIWEAVSDRWWGHICSWRLFSRIRMRASIPRESKHCNTDGRSVWTAGDICWKINHIWSNSTFASQSAYELFSPPSCPAWSSTFVPWYSPAHHWCSLFLHSMFLFVVPTICWWVCWITTKEPLPAPLPVTYHRCWQTRLRRSQHFLETSFHVVVRGKEL